MNLIICAVGASGFEEFVFGFVVSASVRDAFLFGVVAGASVRDAFLFGVVAGASERDTFLFGVVAGARVRDAFLFGVVRGASERDVFLFGVLLTAPSSAELWKRRNLISRMRCCSSQAQCRAAGCSTWGRPATNIQRYSGSHSSGCGALLLPPPSVSEREKRLPLLFLWICFHRRLYCRSLHVRCYHFFWVTNE